MKQIRISILMFFIFTIITGVIYPFFITGIGKIFFNEKRNGSLIIRNGKITGSELIGQKFDSPGFFQGRPSAVNYNGGNSGASNLSQTNKKFIEDVKKRAVQTRKNFNLSGNEILPSDILFASGSGLDPHISIESALLQADKIASELKIDKSLIIDFITANSVKQYYFSGHSYVNVVKLNTDLTDKGYRK